MYEVAFTCDADEPSEDAVDDHEDVEFPVAGVEGVEDGKDAARAGRHQRRAGGLGRKDPQPTRYSWQGKVLYYALPPEHTVHSNVSPKVLPALKASQPHQSMKRPMTALVGLPIGGSPSMSKRPRRGPIILAAVNAGNVVSIGHISLLRR